MEAQFMKRFHYCLILLSWVSISFSQVPKDMVTIGAGSYVPLYGTTDKKPVFIKSFLLDVYPVTNQEYLESSTCSEALVSIEIISAYKNADCSNVPEEVKIWLSTKKGFLFRKKPEFTSIHTELAKQALEKIISSSELKDLWQDSEHFEEWCGIQNKLGQSLDNA